MQPERFFFYHSYLSGPVLPFLPTVESIAIYSSVSQLALHTVNSLPMQDDGRNKMVSIPLVPQLRKHPIFLHFSVSTFTFMSLS